MHDASDLLQIMKKAATEAVNAGQPSDFCFGRVVQQSPLRITVEQKMTLAAAQLVLTRNVTDFETYATPINWFTEAQSDTSITSHTHKIEDKRKITIHNSLQVGDEVILLKQKGGQKYLVLDRVVTAK